MTFSNEFDASALGPPSRFVEKDPVDVVTARIEVAEEEIDLSEVMKNEKKHLKLREHCLSLIQYSERNMSSFAHRWQANELRMQAYITHPENERILKEQNDSGEIPSAVRIIVPFGYAAMSTLSAFFLHTFTTRKPIFHIGSYNDESVEPAKNMEQKLQYDATKTRLSREFYQGYIDSIIYGHMAHKITWLKKTGMRTKSGPEGRIRQREIVYEGNKVEAIDPFMFFPDPRVPIHKVSEDGEFVFWRAYVSWYDVKNSELDGDFFRVNEVTKHMPANEGSVSNRARLASGSEFPALDHDGGLSPTSSRNFVQLDQGTVMLIPREWGLGNSESPKRYLVTIANKDKIIGLQEYDTDVDRHPVECAEPFGTGYSFGQPGAADYIGPIQDMLSWLVNSRIDNVKTTLNNMWVVDPLRVMMSDLVKPGAGKIIRLKDTAIGTDVNSAIQQLTTIDVTSGHLKDFELMMGLGQMLLALNENIMGQPQTGGRKTATEIRVTGESAVNRLTASARVISTQHHMPLAEQMALNNQQYLSDEFRVRILGQQGQEHNITTDSLIGDFEFPIHDGTLPLDRAALVETWKEILLGIAQDPELRSKYDFGKIFENVAELGGAQDIQNYRLQPQGGLQANVDMQPDNQVLDQVAGGELVPIQQALGGS